MKRSRPGRYLLFLMGMLPLGLVASPCHADTTIFLVRHAERTDGGEKDPGLTSDGAERARLLRDMLRSVELGAVYSTDTRRTRDTAQPTAESHKLEVSLYDHKDLPGFAARLMKEHRNETVLITGHTNTLPPLIRELGVKKEIDVTDAEYDNLFMIMIPESGEPRFLHLHYGY
jgi:broad specificity phosphatase PhoE